MSGHSKWNNIKHKKEKTDAQRAKIFTKVGKEIAIAVKESGADQVTNSKLRDLVAKAKSLNVPNDNIERIIKKASGTDAAQLEEIYYEGYGPSGVAVIVHTTTDNRNRTASDLRHYFDKFGGNLGQTGCVGYLFSDCGTIIILNEDEKINEDTIMEQALESGASDFAYEDGAFIIKTEPDDLYTVRDAIEKLGYTIESAEIEKVPSVYANLSNEDDIRYMNLLLEHLDDNDDVMEVFHNWENCEEE